VKGPVVLVVLDGFGIGEGNDSDATRLAHSPFLDRAGESYPSTRIETSGEAVGLPPGQIGNSEVGHMTMGSGRIPLQSMTHISRAMNDGELPSNAAIESAIDAVAASGGRLHLIGLLSDGGVHSHLNQLQMLIQHLGSRGAAPVLHAFLDGRDVLPGTAIGFMHELIPVLDRSGGHVATVTGRYFSMDRDNRWERISRTYDAMVCREGQTAADPIAAIENAYARDESDEFVQPTIIEGGARIGDGDAVICFNFRADRVRQITNALTGVRPDRFKDALERKNVPKLERFVCLTEYDAEFGLPVAYPSEPLSNTLGEIVSRESLKQLRLAETEKYAHVTFFFNGGIEAPFSGEDRVLIDSPRDVPTYDHKPEMSAFQLTDEALRHIAANDYAFILINYANPDMLGHTGILEAAVKAVETVDQALERLAQAVGEVGGTLLVTADHGNCELMRDPASGKPHTAHTTNPVPLFWIAQDSPGRKLKEGGLADLAPTVLDLMGLPIPKEMSGRSLIVHDS
jgi:2,3-bisphosphoglycerate-independent phosphoglycerate mutase